MTSIRVMVAGTLMPELAQEFLRGKRVVVFGAGYIGGRVAEWAACAGADVVALTRSQERAARLEASGLRVVAGELGAIETWIDRIGERFDYVLNSVASGGGGTHGYRQSYVEGWQALLDWARRTGQRGFAVYTSSTSVYGQDGGVRVNEEAPTAAGDERTQLLLEAEQLAQQWPGPTTILRLAGLYGPGRHSLLDALRRGDSTLPGRPEHHLNLAHRDDVVRAVLACWAQPAQAGGEIFNVVDDHPTRRREVVAWLAERLAQPLPAFTGVAARGRRTTTPDRMIENSKLQRVLGWRPVFPSFRDGYDAILRDAETPGAEAQT